MSDIGPLTAPVNRLDGVGPARAERLAHLLGRPNASETRIIDLLLHRPTGVIDRRNRVTVADAPDRAVATLTVRVERHEPSRRPRGPARVIASDDTGEIALVYFRGSGKWRAATYPVGAWVRVSGLIEWYQDRPQIVHPEQIQKIDGPEAADSARFGLEATYPLTQGITAAVLTGLMAQALARVPDLQEWLNEAFVAARKLPTFRAALHCLHKPSIAVDITPNGAAASRLAYDELLASQLALAVVRDRDVNQTGRARTWDRAAIDALEQSLPFPLTNAQRLAIADVAGDLAAPNRMVRLLQGDVGAGKTLVAVFGAAMAASSGGQTAVMAPTDIVARQHFNTFAKLLSPAGFDVRLLTGKIPDHERARALQDLASGAATVVVGTHALFQSKVEFADLALVVVDEQHRFGVHQRMALSQKGPTCDLLVMTATPIPRTLVLAQFGDMDVSKLTDKPAGRSPVETRAVPLTELDRVIERLAAAIARGEKAYWICPLVDENEALEAEAAVRRHHSLTERLGPVAGLLHGRTPAAERESVMSAFKDGGLGVLVATTVVEVGVDVPDATIIVIENAERFGLSQLHQLRGRVGRSAKPSTCLLLYRAPLGPVARQRLDTMRATNDGFRIAEDDLKLRGEGELLGTRQSGAPSFRFADVEVHADLLAAAAADAKMIVAQDRNLTSPRGQALRALLALFERRRAIERLRAG